MRARVRGGHIRGPPGGILTYGTERLLEEASYVAYYFHWPLNEILDLEHPLRRAFVAQIAAINERLSAPQTSEPDDETGW